MYNSLQELLQLSLENEQPLWETVLRSETRLTGMTEEAVFARLAERLEIMRQSAQGALEEPLGAEENSLISGMAKRQHDHALSGKTLCGEWLNLLMARALSCSEVNAAMGKICAAPTAGACGVLPAVLLTVGERYDLPERKLLEALLVSSGVGAVITQNATVSGAKGGCQAECGVAAAMAAAAAVYMADGTAQMSLDAASFALIQCMGLVCDPIAGLVQIPCAQRNASQAVNAVLSADLVLGGMTCPIPPDQVVEAMYRTGKLLPMQLRETALGGIAATEAGREIAKNMLK